jgi:hypothetical protein
MKKKQPQVAPAPPQQKPAAPAKKAAPPQAEPTPKPAGQDKNTPEATAPTAADQGKDFSEVPVQSADKKPDEKPSDTPQAAPRAATGGEPGTQQWTPPKVTVPHDPIDWFAMRQPFTDRGLPLTLRDADQIRQNWSLTYRNMVPIFGPDLAVKIANLGTPIAYDFALARDNPTQIEKFDMETEKMLPPGKKLGKIVVPIITPDTLSWSVEKLTGKKIDFRF